MGPSPTRNWSCGIPASRAAAAARGLNVLPGARRPWVATSNWVVAAWPASWMARTAPVRGSTATRADPRSPSTWSRAVRAAAWRLGSTVVRISSPPVRSRRRRSASVSPKAGLARNSRLTASTANGSVTVAGREGRTPRGWAMASVAVSVEIEPIDAISASDLVAAGGGGLGGDTGIEGGRGPDEPGQQRRLGDGQVGDGHPEELLGGRGHAVGLGAEVDLVQVALEELVLAPPLLEGHRVEQLLGLAQDALLVAHEVLLRHLLGDGGAALFHLTGPHVRHQGPEDGPPVVAAVVPEVVVLGRQHRLADDLGDLVEGDDLAVHAVVEDGHPAAVGREDGRALVEAVQASGGVREGPRRQPQGGTGSGGQDRHRHGHAGDDEDTQTGNGRRRRTGMAGPGMSPATGRRGPAGCGVRRSSTGGSRGWLGGPIPVGHGDHSVGDRSHRPQEQATERLHRPSRAGTTPARSRRRTAS